MKRLNLALTPNVLLYAASSAVLGLILGIWMQAGNPVDHSLCHRPDDTFRLLRRVCRRGCRCFHGVASLSVHGAILTASHAAARMITGGYSGMTNKSNNDKPGMAEKEVDKYTGMRSINFELSPNVLICAAAGAVLGLILAMWGTTSVGIIVAVVIVFTILSGIFGMFV